ncbi:MAG: hypothetical protein RI885_2782 [Actinomycetota bacterium]
MTLSVAVVAISLALTPTTPAEAAVVQWGTAGGTAPNYQATVNGDYLLVGNGVLACSGATVLTANQATAGTCDELHAATGTNTGNANDNFQMVNANTVAGFTTNSTSASVTIPAGATVAKAFLNWSANTGTFLTGTTVTTTCVNATNRNPSAATLPAGSATGYLTQPVQLKVGGGAITSVPVGSVLEDPASQTSTRNYSAGADVTAAFSGATTGSPITISAGNIWAPTGAGCYAGWSLTVVYDYGTYVIGQPASVPHRIIYYEGHVREAATDAPLTVNFTGFTAITTGTRLGLTTFEGDRVVVGDTASYSRQGSATFTEIPNSAGATGNVGIGRANGSVRYTGAGTTTFTNASTDVFSNTLGNVVTGDTSVALRIGTTGDSYLLRNAVLSVPIAALQVDKTFNGTADSQSRTSGETATFTITVTNTGAGDLQNITIADDQTNCSRTLTGVVLAPLASTTFTCTANAPTTATYTSTVTATGYTVSGNFAASDSDTTNVLLSAVGLTKSSALAAGATGRAGDTVNYTFVVTNTGSAPLTGVAITDPLPGLSALTYTWPGVAGTLTAGQSATATATYVLTQANVDAGSVANTAATVGTDDDGGPKPTASATRTTPITSAGALAVTKAGVYAGTGTGRVGDVVNYSFTVRNTGNVTLTNTTLVDPLPGLSPPVVTWPTATAGTLAPGATATATASYTITQADVDAGSVRNTATASGKPPTGANVQASSPQSVVPTIASSPSITTTKSAAVAGSGRVGDVITYSFVTRNNGNVTLTGVAITDTLAGLSAIGYGTWPSGTVGTLAPGQQVTATATYTITQADVDAGSVKNTATSTGKPPTGANVTGSSPQVTTPTAATAPATVLTKSGSAPAGAAAGSTVTYSFSLRNSGNVTLTQVAITDPLPGLSTLTYTWPATPGTLSPGQTVTATATYTLKQSDVDAGSVANTATSTGKPPTGANVTRTASATVPVTQAPALVVTKAGALAAGATGAVGDRVDYTFTVRNSGNVTLTQVALTDPLPGLSALTYTWPATAGTLNPGQTATVTASYLLRQTDVDAGSVKNTASASGKPPTGANVSASSPQTTVATAASAPAITTTKSAARAGSGAVGDVITYTVVARNSGNVTLTGVAVSDPLPGLSAFSYGAWPSGITGQLAPGQSVTATATYTIRQSDVDSGSVRNTAASTGKPPTGANVSGSSAQVTTPTATAAPSVVQSKSGALAAGATGVAGDRVDYSFSLRNSGTVTLTGVAISDPLAGLSALAYTWPGTPGSLAPGQTVTAAATYTLTQADVDAGSVANTATGSGRAPSGATVSSSAPATVPVSSAPALLVTKSGVAAAPAGVGSAITYSFSARNTGNVTLTGVVINDPLAGLSARTYTWPGAVGTLAPGQTVTATATYTITQSDVDAGSVKNTATATGRTPGGATVSGSSPQSSVATAASAPGLVASKSAARGGSGAVGDVITYSFGARNSGNVTLTGVVINDPLPGLSARTYTWPGAVGTLAPGQTVTATATYTITQPDVDSGSVRNTATASGIAPGGAQVQALSPAVTTPTAASTPATVLTKVGALVGPPSAGSRVDYTFTLRNSGNVSLTGVAISDALVGLSPFVYSWPATAGSLAPGQTVTATASYTVTQADVDAGAVANTATSTATPPAGAAVTRSTPATVPLASAGALVVTKAGAVVAPGTGIAGDTIGYTITARNSGNVTLTGVTITDSKPGVSAPVITWPGTPGTLAPGQTATATASYVLTQADVDTGSVRNTATSTGRTPAGVTVTASSPESVVPTATAAPSITTTKTGAVAPTEAGNAGDTVRYTLRATNSGNVTLTGVALSDPKPGLSALTYAPWPGPVGTLTPGQSITATATYRLTQADVDAGSTSNTASSTGSPPSGAAVADDSPTTVVQSAASAPDSVLTKSGVLAAGSTRSAGDRIDYSFSLRNGGNVTLTAVSITDPLPGLSALVYTWPGAPGTLAPGQVVTATAGYLITQADVDAGSVANTASSTATPPTGAAVTRSAPATVPITSTAAITVTKSGAIASPGTGVAGDSLSYSFVLRNAGNVTLTGITLSDSKPGVSTPVITWPGTPGRLEPGQTATATATYPISQADVDAGSVTNTATGSGTPPTGAPVGASSAPSVVALAAPAPALVTTKSGAASGSAAVGDTITYAISARNTGNVTLTGVAIADTLAGLSPLTYSWPGAVGVLEPGQTVTASATYTITQADVDTGAVSNTATTTATPPSGAAVSASSPASVVATAASAPTIAIDKSGSLGTGARGVPGDVVTYSFALRNTGNVTLTGVTVTDTLPGLSSLSYVWPGAAATLAPGQTATATATYALLQADVDAGSVANTGTVRGTPPTGGAAIASDPATVPIPRTPALEVTKAGTVAGAGVAGDVVTYEFSVVNRGNVTLSNISLVDSKPGISAPVVTWPGQVGVLGPAQTATATATYVLTQGDVDTGFVLNTATATGRDPGGVAVSAVSPESRVATAASSPSLVTGKTATVGGTGAVGDTVRYDFTVANSGTVTLTGVTITDPLPGLSPVSYGPWPSGAAGVLRPGQTVTATAVRTVTQADVDRGSIANTATSTGTPPTGPAVSDDSDRVIVQTAASVPSLVTAKSASLAPGAIGEAGDEVLYTFSLRNGGNVTLTGASLSDPLPGLGAIAYTWPVASAPGTLTPGQTATATARYTLTQADVDAGSVANTVTGSAATPGGSATSSTDSATVAFTARQGLVVEKSGELLKGDGSAGDPVEYTIVVRNTGTVTLRDIQISDPLPGLSELDIAWPGERGVLLPGESATARANYTVVQEDVDSGAVRNRASAVGVTPAGEKTEATSEESVVPTAKSGAVLQTTKSGAVIKGDGGVGSIVEFTIVVRNIGNVTVREIAIRDDLEGLSDPAVTWPGAVGELGPRQQATATAQYTITQADVDAGAVRNTATASGVDPDGREVTDASPQASVDTERARPDLTATHVGTLRAGNPATAGDTVDWAYSLTNTGNVTLTGVTLVDLLPGLSALDYTWPGAVGVLAPGQTVTATATSRVTQADLDAGSVSSTLVGTGSPPSGADATASAPATVTLTGTPGLEVSKAAAFAAGDTGLVGDTIEYRFTLVNTGTVTLDQVTLVDALAGLSTPVVTWPGAPGVLTPGDDATATATYVVTQDDVDRGTVTNRASTSGRAPDGSRVGDDSDPVIVTLAASAPAIETTKSGAISGAGVVGDTVRWTFAITNTGTVTLDDIVLADSYPSLSTPVITWPRATRTLGPGETATATATSTVTQADVDTGSITNVATSTGTAPDGSSTSGSSAPAVVPLAAAAPAATLVKTGELGAGQAPEAGSRVDYSFVYRNTGTVTLRDVVIADALPGLSPLTVVWPGPVGVLAPGEQALATAAYTLTQADVDAGSVANTATATATPARGSLDPRTAPATVPLAAGPALTVTKTGALDTGDAGTAGDTVRYDFTLRNAGNVTLTGVALDDALPGVTTPVITWPGTPGELLPGQSATATASYVLTQLDVDAGSVRNTATATGTPPTGPRLDVDSAESVVQTAPPVASLATVKAATVAGTGARGDVVTYEIRSTNTGNQTLTDVAIRDPLAGLSALDYTWPAAAGVLLPGQTVVATGTYTLTQADIDAGRVVNTATATATSPAGAAVTGASSENVVETAPAVTTIEVTHGGVLVTGAGGPTGYRADWSYSLTNTGTVTLTGVTLVDPQPGQTDFVYSWPGNPGLLLPGQTVTATSRYLLSQADVDAGSVTTTVTGSGTPPSGESVTGTAPATVVVTAAPGLAVTKSGVIRSPGTGIAGDVIDYGFDLTNTGNVTLTLVDLVDSLRGLSDLVIVWPGTPGVLAPGEVAPATARYTITQADVDSGSIVNVATATGKTPAGDTITVSSPTSTVSAATPASLIATTKSAVLSGTGVVGDRITYTLTSQNNGNVTLTGVTISDDLPGLAPLAYGPWPSGTPGTLTPGQTVTATTTYVITQADVDRGRVDNAATSSGRSPQGLLVTDDSPPVSTPTVAAAPSLTASKSAALAAGSTGIAGDRIEFTVGARNTGNVTLTGVSLSDALPGISGLDYDWPGTPGTLAPGQAVTATADYVVTQADVDAGSVANAVTAVGTPPTGAALTSTAPATVPIAPVAALDIVGIGTLEGAGIGQVGDIIRFSGFVQYTGNVTLTNVLPSASLPGLFDLSLTWPGTPGTLLPGQDVTGSGRYVITQADVDRGYVESLTGVTGRTPAGALVSASPDLVRVNTVQAAPGVSTVKTASPAGGAVGDTVGFIITTTNTGNVTLRGVVVTDPKPGATPVVTGTWPETPGTLAPRQSVVSTSSYVLTQADIDAGTVSNTATSTATSPSGVEVSDADTVTVATAAAAPSLTATDSGVRSGGPVARAGDLVTWTYVLRNTGTVTLEGVTVTEALAGTAAPVYTWPGDVGVLAPGAQVTATAEYRLTQADIDAGTVTSRVEGRGTPPSGADVTAPATATVTMTAAPATSITQVAALDGAGVVGDTITYTFAVTNTGNQTLTGVDLAQSNPGLPAPVIVWPGVPGRLLPGETATATSVYTVTQADVDAGEVRNTERTSGRSPSADTVTATSTEAVTPLAGAAPELTTVKTGELDAGGAGAVGDIVRYGFEIENTGTVTLTSVTLTDPLVGLAAPVIRWPGTPGTLAPGQLATATATYAITQADVDAGLVRNIATSAGTPPTGPRISDASDESVVDTEPADPRVTVTDSGALAPGATGAVGDRVTFTYTVTNTGNQTLDAVTFSDALPGVGAPAVTWPGVPGVLLPGQTATATADYLLTRADVDAGSVTSVVTGAGLSPADVSVAASAPATVPITSTPGLAVTQTAAIESPGIGAVGDIVFISVVVTNTGNVTVVDGRLVAPLPGLFDIVINWPGPVGTLEAGQSLTGSARYRIQQSDVDAGFVTNIVDIAGTAPDGSTVTAASNSVTIPTVRPAPALTTTKSGAFAAQGRVGDTITYQLAAANSGNVTLTGVVIDDPLSGLSAIDYGTWPSGTVGTLAPGETVRATATYVITQDDVDTGSVTNTATSTGEAPDGARVSDPSEPVVTPTVTPTAPALVVTNSAALAPGGTGVAGDRVVLTYTFTNTGDVSLFGSTLADPAGGIGAISYLWPAAPGTLAPGQRATATAEYVLTQADVDAGSYVNRIDATGTPRVGAPATASAVSTVSLAANPQLVIVKTGSLAVAGDASLGDGVVYGFTIANRGNVTLDSVAITDELDGLSAIAYRWPGAPGILLPGEEATATATYALRQVDLDRGRVDNTATVSGATPAGATVLSAAPLVSVPTDVAAPSLTTTKSGAVTAGTGTAGSTVTYTFAVTNTGNVTLRLVAITDALPGVSRPVVSFPGTSGILAPGGTATGTATYTITQADVDRGFVVNTATGLGTAPDGTVVDDPSDPSTVATAPAAPSIVTTHTAALAAGDTGVVGDVVDYTFRISNGGNVTLTGVTLANTVPGLGPVTYTWPGTPGTLAPGQSVTAIASHPVTQADVDAGSVRNVSTGSGAPPTGARVSDPSDETVVPLAAAAGTLSLVKSGAATASGEVGDTIGWQFTLTNTGPLTLRAATVVDTLPGLSAITYGTWPSGTAGVLAPGDVITATATSTITQADVDRGLVRNSASATASEPDGDTVGTPVVQAVVATAVAGPAVTIEKQQALAPGSTGRVGDVVLYTYQLVNSGNVTLTGVVPADAQPGIEALDVTWPGTPGTLLPGQVATATSRYVLTQADVDAGAVASAASVVGTTPSDDIVSDDTTGSVAIAPAPSLVLDKTARLESGAAAGSRVLYGFTATNTGTVTLSGVTISDPLPGLSAVDYSWPGAVGVLAPGESVAATASYVLTQADVDAGTVVNTATVAGESPTGAAVSATDSASQSVEAVPGIRLTVGVKLGAGQLGYPGDRLEYTYTVTNTGNTTLTGVRIIDPRTGLSPIIVGAWPGEPGVLLPGQSVVASAFYIITAADAGRTLVTEARVESINGPDGTGVLDAGVVAITLPPLPVSPVIPPALAFTGTDPASGIAAALTLLLAGLVLMLAGRRRKDSTS